jgi:hypothetical protein
MRFLYSVTAFVVGLGLAPLVLASLLSLVDCWGRLGLHYRRVFGNMIRWGLVTAAAAWLSGDYQWAFWLGLAVYLPYYYLTYLGLKLFSRKSLRIADPVPPGRLE